MWELTTSRFVTFFRSTRISKLLLCASIFNLFYTLLQLWNIQVNHSCIRSNVFGKQDFDFCPNLIKFYSNFTKFTQILPPIYSNLPKFFQICPNLGKNFAKEMRSPASPASMPLHSTTCIRLPSRFSSPHRTGFTMRRTLGAFRLISKTLVVSSKRRNSRISRRKSVCLKINVFTLRCGTSGTLQRFRVVNPGFI